MIVTAVGTKMTWTVYEDRQLIPTLDNYVIPANIILEGFCGSVVGVVVQVYHDGAWRNFLTPEGSGVASGATMTAVPPILSDGTNVRIYNGDGAGRNVDLAGITVG